MYWNKNATQIKNRWRSCRGRKSIATSVHRAAQIHGNSANVAMIRSAAYTAPHHITPQHTTIQHSTPPNHTATHKRDSSIKTEYYGLVNWSVIEPPPPQQNPDPRFGVLGRCNLPILSNPYPVPPNPAQSNHIPNPIPSNPTLPDLIVSNLTLPEPIASNPIPSNPVLPNPTPLIQLCPIQSCTRS